MTQSKRKDLLSVRANRAAKHLMLDILASVELQVEYGGKRDQMYDERLKLFSASACAAGAEVIDCCRLQRQMQRRIFSQLYR